MSPTSYIDDEGVIMSDYSANQYAEHAAQTNLVEDKIQSELDPIKQVLVEAGRTDLIAPLHELQDRLILAHHALGIAGEAGEVAGKVKKLIRDVPITQTWDEAKDDEVAAEIGDVAWYLSQLSFRLGKTFASVLMGNIAKLRSRMERNLIAGSGDDR